MTKAKATASRHRIAWGRYLLVFLIAAWMFILGVLVGRGTAPVQFDTQALQKELATLRDAMMKKEREAVAKAIRGEDQNAPLEFYEALKIDEPDTFVHMPVADQSASEKPPGEGAPETVKPSHKIRTAIMAKKSTAQRKPTVAKTRSTIADTAATTGNLTIQVASIQDVAAAQRIVANLKKDGYSAYLSRIVIPGRGLWFRVRVGSYKDRDQAATDMDRLIRDQKKPILVKK